MSDKHYAKMLEYIEDRNAAMQLAKRIKDLASFFNYPIDDVFDMVCKCFEGDCGPLRVFGIAISSAVPQHGHPWYIYQKIMEDSEDADGDYENTKGD